MGQVIVCTDTQSPRHKSGEMTLNPTSNHVRCMPILLLLTAQVYTVTGQTMLKNKNIYVIKFDFVTISINRMDSTQNKANSHLLHFIEE